MVCQAVISYSQNISKETAFMLPLRVTSCWPNILLGVVLLCKVSFNRFVSTYSGNLNMFGASTSYYSCKHLNFFKFCFNASLIWTLWKHPIPMAFLHQSLSIEMSWWFLHSPNFFPSIWLSCLQNIPIIWLVFFCWLKLQTSFFPPALAKNFIAIFCFSWLVDLIATSLLPFNSIDVFDMDLTIHQFHRRQSCCFLCRDLSGI